MSNANPPQISVPQLARVQQLNSPAFACENYRDFNTAHYFETPMGQVSAAKIRVLANIAMLPGAKIDFTIFHTKLQILEFRIVC